MQYTSLLIFFRIFFPWILFRPATAYMGLELFRMRMESLEIVILLDQFHLLFIAYYTSLMIIFDYVTIMGY